MWRCLPRLGREALVRRVPFGFEFVGELIELVEVDSWSEPEGMRDGLRRHVATRLCVLTQTSAERPVDHILERQIKFARASLQETREVIVDGERSAHKRHHCCDKV